MSTIHLSMAGQDANQLVLPIVFEPNGAYLGNPAAQVTMVQFGDYQCPYCDAFFRDTWPQLKAEYVDTGKIRFLFQDYALFPHLSVADNAAYQIKRQIILSRDGSSLFRQRHQFRRQGFFDFIS